MKGGPHMSLHLRIRLGETFQPQLPASCQGSEAPLGGGHGYSTFGSHRDPEPVGMRTQSSLPGDTIPTPTPCLEQPPFGAGQCSQEVVTVRF